MMKLYLKPNCSTCRNARKFLLEAGAQFEEIDLNRGLTVGEIDALIGDRDYKAFLNTRNDLYREKKMKQSPPSRAEAIALMAGHPNLIKRPVLVKGKQILLGFNPEEMRKAL
jgi:Spx/MgsR family transcriptional regulator